jgi:hypothetical protein
MGIYKAIIVVGFALGITIWYLQFLKECDDLEGFQAAPNNPEKIKSIMKKVDTDHENKKKALKRVKFMASETAEQWTIYAMMDDAIATLKNIVGEIFRVLFAPVLHQVERSFSG